MDNDVQIIDANDEKGISGLHIEGHIYSNGSGSKQCKYIIGENTVTEKYGVYKVLFGLRFEKCN